MKPLPESFQDAVRATLGKEFPAFMAALGDPAPVSIRVHPLKNRRPSRGKPVPWSAWGEYLDTRPHFTLDPLFHAGSYYVQEASSMFLEQAIKQTTDLQRPLRVLDLCAAPGGKSTHLLSLLNRESLLVSNDAIRSRSHILSENIQKWGYPNAIATNNDPADFGRLTGFFDILIVDAPCSGEGLFRKDPMASDEWSPANVLHCASRQKRIISDVWDALRKNGLLVYCTCTYNETENEENLEWLQAHHGAEFLRLTTDAAWGIEEVDRRGVVGYRFFPHRTRGEGFFLSVMRKTEATEELLIKMKSSLPRPTKKVLERLSPWTLQESAAYFQFQDLLFYTPEYGSREVEYLLQHLKIVYAGTNLARIKHEKLIPEHALALSTEINKANFPVLELSEDQALKYLRKEVLTLEGAQPGYTLLTFRDLPFAWANILPNRVNNLYPSEWRIRMADVPLDNDRSLA